MTLRRWILSLVFAGTLPAGRADAHFLFVRILPPAEGGRAAEVYFSELAETGDARFIDKIAHTKLHLQTTPGRFEPLTVHKAPDRLRAFLPVDGSAVVRAPVVPSTRCLDRAPIQGGGRSGRRP